MCEEESEGKEYFQLFRSSAAFRPGGFGQFK